MGTAIQSVGAAIGDGLSEAAAQLRAAAEAQKCWKCGCLRHALEAIDHALPESARPAPIKTAVEAARARWTASAAYPGTWIPSRLASGARSFPH